MNADGAEPGRPPLLVVSPHLDDGVLSCGRLLVTRPGSVVCTVFAGRPCTATVPEGARPGATTWDALCGFRTGDDVVGVRRAEDDAALALLGSRPVHLDFVDAQYAPAPAVDAVAAAVADLVARVGPGLVLVPLGLFHRDHRWTAAACRRVLVGLSPPTRWGVYADAPYRAWAPVRQRLAAWRRAGVRLGRPRTRDDGALSREARELRDAAVLAYTSQQAGLTTLDARATAALGSPREDVWLPAERGCRPTCPQPAAPASGAGARSPADCSRAHQGETLDLAGPEP